MAKWDFTGWATKANLKCSDGRTIMKDAFKDNDGQTVPLVWNHNHNSVNDVLGHALLENRPEGVFAYCTFNDSESGQTAKLLVNHGDVVSLSICANQLVEKMGSVFHGCIREVSLVLAGANPGASIQSVIKHGEESDDEAVIYTGEGIELCHSDEIEEVNAKESSEELKHADEEEKKPESSEEDKSVKQIYEEMTEEQKTVVQYLVGAALDAEDKSDDDEKEEKKEEKDEGGNDSMKHNVFENEDRQEGAVLTHSQLETIINDGKRYGSMKESFLAHAEDYGIQQIDWLFPEAKTLNNPPEFIKRDTSWVSKVMGATHKTPFSRIKSVFADITEDEARAKGYIKGKLKKEEVFSLLKRTTTPTTIYKKQKMDRDDVIDITDFDVVSWLKAEMRMMLDEEIARAILIGDGRLASDDDKINEQNIRPVWTDADLYTVKALIDTTGATTADQKAKAFIRTAIKSRKNYKGSGNPVLFTTEDVLTDCLLIEDANGRIIYDSVAKLATTLRVREIVTVPVMENLTRDVAGTGTEASKTFTHTLWGIIVNLADYNVGADKGGAINMFDDFDIDYNQQKYLIETRCSGALIKPYSAITLETRVEKSAG